MAAHWQCPSVLHAVVPHCGISLTVSENNTSSPSLQCSPPFASWVCSLRPLSLHSISLSNTDTTPSDDVVPVPNVDKAILELVSGNFPFFVKVLTSAEIGSVCLRSESTQVFQVRYDRADLSQSTDCFVLLVATAIGLLFTECFAAASMLLQSLSFCDPYIYSWNVQRFSAISRHCIIMTSHMDKTSYILYHELRERWGSHHSAMVRIFGFVPHTFALSITMIEQTAASAKFAQFRQWSAIM